MGTARELPDIESATARSLHDAARARGLLLRVSTARHQRGLPSVVLTRANGSALHAFESFVEGIAWLRGK